MRWCRAERLGVLELLLAARGGDDRRRAGELRHLHRGAADARARGLDEHGLSRLQEAARDEHVPGGAEGDLRRGRILEAAPARAAALRLAIGTHDVLGVAAGNVEAEVAFLHAQVVAPGEAELALAARDAAGDPDAVAFLEHACTVQRGDLAGELAPEDVRELDRNARGAGAVVEVDMVDADRAHAHQRLAGLRRGLRRLFVDQDLGPAELVEPARPSSALLGMPRRIASGILRLRYWPSFRSPWNLPSATITLPRSTVDRRPGADLLAFPRRVVGLVQVLRAHRAALARVEHDDVGIAADRDRALARIQAR